MRKILFIAFLMTSTTGCEGLFFDDKAETDYLDVYDAFYDEIDLHFSFFPYLSADFDSAYRVNRVALEEDLRYSNLLSSIGELINFLEDGHTDVFLAGGVVSYTGWYDQYPRNELEDISSYFASFTRVNQALAYGRLSDYNLGYIKIDTFTGNLPTSNYQAVDQILESLQETDGIIIDVRSNGGGSSNNSDRIASRFNDAPRLAFDLRRREGENRTDFGPWFSKYTEVYSGYRYLKPVAVLTNRRSFSATEWFTAEMRTMPHVTIVGDTTGGGSGNPLLRDLPNGWTLRVSHTQKRLPEGRDYQFTGIYPDVPVWITPGDSLAGTDTILETAINMLIQ